MSALSWVPCWSRVLLTAFMSWRLHDATSQYILYTHTHTHTHTLWYFESYNESPFPRLLSEYLSTILSFYGGLLSSQETWRHKSLHCVSQWVGGCQFADGTVLREVERALRDDAGGSKAIGNYLPFLYWHRSDNKCGKVSCARPKDERASGATANMLCASEVFHVLRYYAARLVIRDNLPQGQAARVFWDVNAAWYRSPRRFGLLDPRRWDRTVVLKHR